MDEYLDFDFTCDQVVLLAWVEEQDPALFERIRARVAEGRWINTGGWWVEPDCNLPVGESFVRQGLWGQRFLQQRFGRRATVGMNVDPFGHAGTIPQVLVGQGMTAYCFLRPMAHEKALPSALFRWRAPDGTEVLAFRIPFEYQSSREGVDRHIEKALAEFSQHIDERLPETMVFYGVGNHGGGPTIKQIETIHRFDRMGSFGALPLSDPETYFTRVRALDLDLPVVEGDLQHHAPGCYSAHSGIKQWQRRAQSTVLVAERWAAIAALDRGDAVPRADLERAWKQVLLNQAHDILPGSAIEAAFVDARDQLGEAIATAKRITARAHNRIAAAMDRAARPRHAARAGVQPPSVAGHRDHGAAPGVRHGGGPGAGDRGRRHPGPEPVDLLPEPDREGRRGGDRVRRRPAAARGRAVRPPPRRGRLARRLLDREPAADARGRVRGPTSDGGVVDAHPRRRGDRPRERHAPRRGRPPHRMADEPGRQALRRRPRRRRRGPAPAGLRGPDRHLGPSGRQLRLARRRDAGHRGDGAGGRPAPRPSCASSTAGTSRRCPRTSCWTPARTRCR